MSEIRALRWPDVDLEERRLHVRQRADKWQEIGALKSETSYRPIPMPPMAVNALTDVAAVCSRVIEPGELVLVFPTGAGSVESLPNIWNRHLAPLQVAAGVVTREGRAKYGAHAFRHFFVSWLIDQGFNVKRISVLAGHSTPVVTLTIYAHLMPQDDEHAQFAAGELALVGS